MLKNIQLFLLLLFITLLSVSQGTNLIPITNTTLNSSRIPFPGEPCASSYLEEELLRTDPAYVKMRNLMEQQVQHFISQQSSSRSAVIVYTIPVVFHIMHSGEALGDSTNISYAQALSCIAALNRDFRRTNTNGGIAQSGPLGVDAEIEFCIAQRDPIGNATNGVTRHDMSGNQNYLDSGVYHNSSLWRGDAFMKTMVQWNPAEYLNVWVVNKIRSTTNIYAGGGGGVIGYATFPGGSSASDGVVIRFSATGNDPTGTLGYNLWFATDDNRVLTHELGHYLNLYHTFQSTSACGSSGLNCATIGDRCCDTPPTTVGMGNNCTSPVCPLDNKENYMQYQNGACASDFTPDQVARMRAVLASTASWARNALVTNNNCVAPITIDLKLDTIFVPNDTICSTSFTPEIVVCNTSALVTSFNVTYKVDTGLGSTFNWTGNLLFGECDTFFLPSITSTNGVHTFTARIDSATINGVDSDINISNNSKTNSFTIAGSNALIQYINACDSFVSPTGKVWKTNGSYFDTLSNVFGCDSLMIFNLSISPFILINKPTISACDSIQINSIWYSSSQTIHDTVISSGCDSINSTPIVIGTNSFSITTLAFCDSLVSLSGKVYKNSGFFRDTMPNASGCDSLVEYYLTANRSTVSNNLITACGSYTSPFGTTYTTSGNYADTIASSLGCDSIINTFLIIDTVETVTIDSTLCLGDSIVLSNGTVAKTTGIYRDTILGSISSSLIYSEDFQGITYSFTLNTNDTNAITPGSADNAWIINNSYLGGSVFGSPIVNTPNQDAGITGNSNSTYLHIYNRRSAALSFPSITNSNYIDANILLLGGQNGLNFSKMTNDISTLGKSHVSFEMYYLCRGSFGRLYYSLNSGITWARVGGNINNGGTKWSQLSIVDPVFANQATIKFAVGFNNTDGVIGITPGFAIDEIAVRGIAVSGSNCDSITILNVSVLPLIDTNIYDTICRGQSITLPNGGTVNSSGIYSDTLTARSGCDSIVITTLLVNDTTQSNFTLIGCDSITSPSGKIWKISGSYIDSIPNSIGCDSILFITAIIDTVVVTRIDTLICQGDSIFFKDVGYQNSSGIYISTFSTIKCDSLVWYNLTVLSPSIVDVFDSICANESFMLPSGNFVTAAGIYRDTLNSSVNCDSIVITNLTVKDTSSSFQLIITCDSLISPSGKIWKTTGMYLDTITNSEGCDSLIAFNLTISTTTFIIESDTACDSLVWKLKTRTATGIYYDTITTLSCDTIYVLNLLIYNSSVINNSIVSCDLFTLPGGTTVYISGLYRDTLETQTGCDSIINSSVMITTASTSSITASSCTFYTSPSGKIITTTGVFNDTIPNAGGCDSLMTINLTILTSTSSTVLANGCDTFSLPGGTIATATGTYRDTLINGNGCDSIIITNLILGYSSNVTQNFSLCAGETVTVGSNIYGATGMYSDTFTTTLGCDSIINTNLLINPLTPGVITSTIDLCQDAAIVKFTAIPAGGNWGGLGIDITTGFFDPALAGAGIHTITYTGSGPCGRTDSVAVEVYSIPTITYTLIDDECDLGEGEIDITIIGGTPTIIYTWSTGDITEDLNRIKQGIFTLTVVDAKGCTSSETMSIINVSTVDCNYNIFIPNVFSPDGNGENDVLKVEGNGIEALDFSIFNRWGNLIFKSSSSDLGWDGTYKGQPVNQGVFVYFVSGTFVDGNSFEKKGTVTVIRR